MNNRLFTARESTDPVVLDAYRFADDNNGRLEKFIQYFIQSNFGRVAVADDEAYRYFRDRVWLVQPTDRHDFKRCRASHEDTDGSMWPRCLGGTIVRAWPQLGPIPGAGTVTVRRDSVMGSCPCRCHRDQYVSGRINLPGVGQFDEDQLDEKGNPR